jgi:hypothetical protein
MKHRIHPISALLHIILALLGTVATAQVPDGSRDTANTSRVQAERILDGYFAAMNTHDFSQVPFTPEVVFRGSLHTEPIRGDSAVRTFLVAVGKGARNVRLEWRVIDGDRACANYEYQSNAGFVVPAVTCFRFEAGRIAELRAFFDPRPFLTPGPQGKDASGSDEDVAGNPHHRIVPLTAGGMQRFLKEGFEVISGNPAEPGVPFVIRIYNTENQVVPPHWHPEDEHVTVIKGIW